MIKLITVNAVEMSHRLLQERVMGAKCLVDATCGNGRDTVFLARNSRPDAVVWAFDIQKTAIENTRKRITEHGLAHKVWLVEDSHTRVTQYLAEPVDVILFNLGYLPGGDHAVTTRAETTIEALTAVLPCLAPGGIAAIVAYPGHEAGKRENETVCRWLAGLPQQQFAAACWQLVNQVNDPPVLYVIENVGSEGFEGITPL